MQAPSHICSTGRALLMARSAALIVILMLTAMAAPATGQTGSVGIYTDASGLSCSFSGNDPGIVTAYVVARPGPEGFRGVRFSAPVPECFGGIFLGDQVSDGLFSIGSSQTGLSITSGTCESLPLHVLTVTYYRTTSTEACCAFPVLPEPGFSSVQALNCDGQEISWSGRTSHFNSDASCPCAVGVPPNVPSFPHPLDGGAAVSVATALGWSCEDFDGDLADFDVYLGTSSSPPLVAGHLTQPEFQPEPLQELTAYYWRVVAHDAAGHETSGPTWTFTTRPLNSPPDSPGFMTPEDGEVVGGQSSTASVRLEWHAIDVDNDALVYDVYFGSTVPPPLISSGQTFPFKGVGHLAVESTYYWQVAAHDSHGHTSLSDVAHFSTHQYHSSIEWVPVPPSGQTNVPTDVTLSWAPFLNDFGANATYEVYFGYYDPLNTPVATVSTNSYRPPAGFLANHLYTWYIIAYLNGGASIRWGPGWIFATGPSPSNTPSNPLPAYDAVVSAAPLTLQWSVENAPSQTVPCQVYVDGNLLGTTTERSWPLSDLTPGHRYYWGVKPVVGNVAYPGPTWTFKVETNIQPPANPVPPDDGSSALIANLSWSPLDPTGAPVASKVFFSQSDPPAFYGLTTGSTYQIGKPLTPGQHYYWRVAQSDPGAPPGPVWSFVAESETAVLFSHFEASPQADGILVAWLLQSDEAMESYILYRRDGANATPTAIAQGGVTALSGSYVDRTVVGGTQYQYELAIHTGDGDVFRSPLVTATAPRLALALYQNQPNPFNPETTIRYDLPDAGGRTRVHLTIYDVAGRRVRELVNEDKNAGRYSVIWNGRDDHGIPVSSGVYFYRLNAAKQQQTRKLVLLK